MRSVLLAVLLAAMLAAHAWAGDAVVVLQETRTPETARRPRDHRKQTSVRHVALLQKSVSNINGLARPATPGKAAGPTGGSGAT